MPTNPLPFQRATPTPPPAKPRDDLGSRAKHIQELMMEIENLGDERTRDLTRDVLQSVLQLHGTGLSRILEILKEGGAPAKPAYERLLADNVVSGLLLIHDRHPLSLEERMQRALAKVLPYIHGHGGNVELVSLVDGMAKLRLHGTCKSCSASSITLELAVRAAIEEFCPDLLGFEVEGIEPVQVPPPYAACTEPAVPAPAVA